MKTGEEGGKVKTSTLRKIPGAQTTRFKDRSIGNPSLPGIKGMPPAMNPEERKRLLHDLASAEAFQAFLRSRKKTKKR